MEYWIVGVMIIHFSITPWPRPDLHSIFILDFA